MPKFPKGFARRKSPATQIEDGGESPIAEHSFKVFERVDGGNRSFDGGAKFAKDPRVSGNRPGTSHLESDNMFENIGSNRGSGASNTNTMSTTDNSSRLSAASTAPSSTGSPGFHDTRSPHDKPFSDIPLPPIPKSAPGFLKNAGRAMSWGRHKAPTPLVQPASPSTEDEDSAKRTRAVTASSYGSTSTAVPPKLENKDLGLSLGGDFSDMFSGFGKRKSIIMEQDSERLMSRSPDELPSGPAIRSYTSGRSNQLSPINIDKDSNVEESPYSWSSQHSHEALISGSTAPPVPTHGLPRTNGPNPASFSRPQRSGGLVDNGLKRSSARRKSTVDFSETNDEDARLLRDSATASRRMNDSNYSHQVRDSWALPSATSYKLDDTTLSSWRAGSNETTPKAKEPSPKPDEDNLFDSNMMASANIAQRFGERASSPLTKQTPKNRVMTPAQFERYKQDQERMRSIGGQPKDAEDEEEETNYDDDEDEAEKNRELAKQRRKQEAHMAVYRQQMMKVTGEAPSATGRPSFSGALSSPNLGKSEDAEEEDEEVPLGILQAHGFPNKNKPPMRTMGSNPNLRSSSISITQGAGGGSLPVFARNLPQDPYYGAGLVNPMHRESLSFGGGAASVSGGSVRGLPPGGLVGVIATEERSRAMRRGSPNTQGDYGPPVNGFAAMQHARNSSGGSMYNGMGSAGPMPPMMMTPGDQAQIQMTQQMEQFMAMQMQFMQMMTTGQTPMQGPPQVQNNGHMSRQSVQMPRPGSAHAQQQRPMSNHQRAMTMLEPNAAPWMQRGSVFAPSVQGAGYAPSIAPSERSNVGLPGRYRPVSQAVNNTSDSKSMSGALGGWDNKTTVRTVLTSSAVEDEDEEEGWAEMAKKKEKKKSIWKIKKGSKDGLKEMLDYTH